MSDDHKLTVGQLTPLGPPHDFVVGEVTVSVGESLNGREIKQNLRMEVRVPYRPDATLPELQEALRAKALEVIAEILAGNRDLA